MRLCSGHGNSVVIREWSLYPQSLLAKLTVLLSVDAQVKAPGSSPGGDSQIFFRLFPFASFPQIKPMNIRLTCSGFFLSTPNSIFYFLLPAQPGVRLAEVGRRW